MKPFQVQASDEILRIVCFAAVKGSNGRKKEVLMTLGPQVLSGCSANTPYWHVDKERPAAEHSTYVHLSGNGHCYEKSQEPSKWLKGTRVLDIVRVSWLLCVWMEVCMDRIKWFLLCLSALKTTRLLYFLFMCDLWRLSMSLKRRTYESGERNKLCWNPNESNIWRVSHSVTLASM